MWGRYGYEKTGVQGGLNSFSVIKSWSVRIEIWAQMSLVSGLFICFSPRNHILISSLLFLLPSYLIVSDLGCFLVFGNTLSRTVSWPIQPLYPCNASLWNWICPSLPHYSTQALPSFSLIHATPAMKWWRPIAMQTVKWWVHEGDPMDDMGHSNLLLWAWGPVYSLLCSEQPIQHMRWPCIPYCRFQGQKSIGFPAKPRLHSRITWHQRERERERDIPKSHSRPREWKLESRT